MSTFINDPSAMLWDATAVSNAFLCEFMPIAPEGYVKVYLYALMYAHGGVYFAVADTAMAAHGRTRPCSAMWPWRWK